MDNTKIAKRIREIRTEHNLSQMQFGEILLVSQDVVSLWETSMSLPTAEYLISIAQIFHVSVDYILCLIDY